MNNTYATEVNKISGKWVLFQISFTNVIKTIKLIKLN